MRPARPDKAADGGDTETIAAKSRRTMPPAMRWCSALTPRPRNRVARPYDGRSRAGSAASRQPGRELLFAADRTAAGSASGVGRGQAVAIFLNRPDRPRRLGRAGSPRATRRRRARSPSAPGGLGGRFHLTGVEPHLAHGRMAPSEYVHRDGLMAMSVRVVRAALRRVAMVAGFRPQIQKRAPPSVLDAPAHSSKQARSKHSPSSMCAVGMAP